MYIHIYALKTIHNMTVLQPVCVFYSPSCRAQLFMFIAQKRVNRTRILS